MTILDGPIAGKQTPSGNVRMKRFAWEKWVQRWPLSIEARALALTIATFASAAGDEIHPGDDLLAGILRCSRRTVVRNRQRLIDEGLIERTKRSPRRGLADEYVLTVPAYPYETPGVLNPDMQAR